MRGDESCRRNEVMMHMDCSNGALVANNHRKQCLSGLVCQQQQPPLPSLASCCGRMRSATVSMA